MSEQSDLLDGMFDEYREQINNIVLRQSEQDKRRELLHVLRMVSADRRYSIGLRLMLITHLIERNRRLIQC